MEEQGTRTGPQIGWQMRNGRLGSRRKRNIVSSGDINQGPSYRLGQSFIEHCIIPVTYNVARSIAQCQEQGSHEYRPIFEEA